MPGTTLATIQSFIDAGQILTAYHEVMHPNACSHYAVLDWNTLKARFGGDFNLVERRPELIAALRCEKCGRKGSMTITVTPPGR